LPILLSAEKLEKQATAPKQEL